MTTTVTIKRKRQNWYRLLSFVIMYDHFHLIIIPNRKNISHCMKSLKGYSARRINGTLENRGSVWQSGFYDYILASEEKISSRILYVEENPVRKGIVENAEDYEYSSARFREEMDIDILF